MNSEERTNATRLRELTKVNLCSRCKTDKPKCPYPGAFNVKELGHQACEEYKGL